MHSQFWNGWLLKQVSQAIIGWQSVATTTIVDLQVKVRQLIDTRPDQLWSNEIRQATLQLCPSMISIWDNQPSSPTKSTGHPPGVCSCMHDSRCTHECTSCPMPAASPETRSHNFHPNHVLLVASHELQVGQLPSGQQHLQCAGAQPNLGRPQSRQPNCVQCAHLRAKHMVCYQTNTMMEVRYIAPEQA